MNQQLDLFASSETNEQAEEEEERFEQKSHLTPRQWALYRLIHHNSFIEHRKTTQKEIFEKVDGYEWNADDKCHDHCPAIWNDIKDNNMSLEHDTIIITKNFRYWIGNERETKRFLAKLWRDLSPRLTRYWFFVNKVGYDGLGKLYDKNLNQVDYNEEKDKDIKNTRKIFHDCFNEYDIELQKANKKLEEEKEEDEDVEE